MLDIFAAFGARVLRLLVRVCIMFLCWPTC